MNRQNRTAAPLGEIEFISLFAFVTSLTALAISMVLPALPAIGASLATSGAEPRLYLVVTAVVLGMTFGELMFGPLADARGRKAAILAGIALFVTGVLLSVFAESIEVLLAGRVLQGIGVAGPKIGARAAIRDRYSGTAMARAMSLILGVLVLVPMLAPALGELVLIAGSWQTIFLVQVTLSVIAATWLALRHPETLEPERRISFTWLGTVCTAGRILANVRVSAWTLCAGLVFGAQLSYLGIAQSIFEDLYDVGALFTPLFAVLALSTGIASLTNARWVAQLGMECSCRWALVGLGTCGTVLLLASALASGVPPLGVFMVLGAGCFFCIGILLGNLGALAMEPLGEVAGIGASVIASLSSAVAVVLSGVVGRAYDQTLVPLAACMLGTALGTAALVALAGRYAVVAVRPSAAR